MQRVLQGKPDLFCIAYDSTHAIQESSHLSRRYRFAVGGVRQAVGQNRTEEGCAKRAAKIAR